MGVKTGTFDNLGGCYDDGSMACLLSTVANCAGALSSGKGWPHGVDDLLSALGVAMGVSRVWIFQTVKLTDSHITQNYAFEWAATPKFKQIGMPMFSMFTNPIDRPEYKTLIESRKQGEWQKIITCEAEPGWLRDVLEVQKIKSMLTIPVMVDNQWWGTLGFDDCERDYDWQDGEISALRIAGYLISNAVLQDKLEARRKQFDILKRITDSNAWSFDFKTGQVWCSYELIYSTPMPMDSLQFSLLGAMRLLHPEDRRQFIKAVRTYVKNGEGVFRHDVRVFNDCGGIQWVELIGSLSKDDSGKPDQLAGIAVDIGSRKQEEERLQEEATTDPLTGVMNRRMFDRALADQVRVSSETKAPFALLLLDIDYFKGLNDKYGHAVGDGALQYFTEICQENLRSNDVIARLGGDEFAVILPSARRDTAYNVGERIRRYVVSKPYISNNTRIFMTTSIGLAYYDGDIASPEAVVRRADMALYAAKKAGRNCLITSTDPRCLAVMAEELDS